jgi:uncharacterized protein (DUF1501 family)
MRGVCIAVEQLAYRHERGARLLAEQRYAANKRLQRFQCLQERLPALRHAWQAGEAALQQRHQSLLERRQRRSWLVSPRRAGGQQRS